MHKVAKSHGDARVALRDEGLGGMVAHLDDLGGGHDIEVVGVALMLLEQSADTLLVAKKHDAAILANLLQCHHSTLYGYLGSKIATHGVDTDFQHI